MVCLSLPLAGWAQTPVRLPGSAIAGEPSGRNTVAVSEDGSTAIAGAPLDSGQTGAAWILTRSGDAWAVRRTRLTGSNPVGPSLAGSSVAISRDGNTALVGAPGDDSNAGAVWVFARQGADWTEQTKLSVPDSIGRARLGASVAISGDGNTAVAGGPDDRGSAGAVWIFVRSGDTWTELSKLAGSGDAGASRQGDSVAISADGRTIVAGAPGDGYGVGAAWIFANPTGNWVQQGGKLTGRGTVGEAGQGSAVAVSENGNLAVIGGSGDRYGEGAAWVFQRRSGRWSQFGEKLVPGDAVGASAFGASAAVSAVGDQVFIGGTEDNGGTGAVWQFTQSRAGWKQQAGKLVGPDSGQPSRQGHSLAVSGDGDALLWGASGERSSIWSYRPSAGSGCDLREGGASVSPGALRACGPVPHTSSAPEITLATVSIPAGTSGQLYLQLFTGGNNNINYVQFRIAMDPSQFTLTFSLGAAGTAAGALIYDVNGTGEPVNPPTTCNTSVCTVSVVSPSGVFNQDGGVLLNVNIQVNLNAPTGNNTITLSNAFYQTTSSGETSLQTLSGSVTVTAPIPPTLSFGSAAIAAGSSGSLNVTLTTNGHSDIAKVGITITNDPSQFTLSYAVGAAAAAAGDSVDSEQDGAKLAAATPCTGTSCFVAIGAVSGGGAIGDGVVLIITIQVKASASTGSKTITVASGDYQNPSGTVFSLTTSNISVTVTPPIPPSISLGTVSIAQGSSGTLNATLAVNTFTNISEVGFNVSFDSSQFTLTFALGAAAAAAKATISGSATAGGTLVSPPPACTSGGCAVVVTAANGSSIGNGVIVVITVQVKSAATPQNDTVTVQDGIYYLSGGSLGAPTTSNGTVTVTLPPPSITFGTTTIQVGTSGTVNATYATNGNTQINYLQFVIAMDPTQYTLTFAPGAAATAAGASIAVGPTSGGVVYSGPPPCTSSSCIVVISGGSVIGNGVVFTMTIQVNSGASTGSVTLDTTSGLYSTTASAVNNLTVSNATFTVTPTPKLTFGTATLASGGAGTAAATFSANGVTQINALEFNIAMDTTKFTKLTFAAASASGGATVYAGPINSPQVANAPCTASTCTVVVESASSIVSGVLLTIGVTAASSVANGSYTLTTSSSRFAQSTSGSGAVIIGNVAVTVAAPVLEVSVTNAQDFTVGATNQTYTVSVTNSSLSATVGTVQVMESVPSGLTLQSMAGTGWTCGNPTGTCSRTDSLQPGATYPLTVTVNVTATHAESVTNSVRVSGGGASTAIATDSTTILAIACDLTGDGSATVADVQRAINESLGTASPVDDLNQDGIVNIVDVQIVMNAVLSLGCKAT